jgi:branched-chain amino acid transport system permease protein
VNLVRIARDRGIFPGAYAGLIAGGVVAAVVVGVAVLVFNTATAGQFNSLLIATGVAAVMTVGYQIFVGNTGIVSFGHPSFVALGAYAAGIVSMPAAMKASTLPNLPGFLAGVELTFLPSLVIGGLVAAVVALAIGPIVMRLAGATAGIMTFGLLVITNEVLRNATDFTKGTQTFFGVPKYADFVTVYGTLVVVVAIAVAFKFSSAGLRARAVRDDPLASETVGISVVKARLWAWCVSAFVMGMSGALFGFFLTAFSPKSFYVELVIPMMVMAVLGGLHSVSGALAGTIIITLWGQLMRLVEGGALGFAAPLGLSQLTLGVGLVLLLYWRPFGLMGSYEFEVGPFFGLGRRERRRAMPESASTQDN